MTRSMRWCRILTLLLLACVRIQCQPTERATVLCDLGPESRNRVIARHAVVPVDGAAAGEVMRSLNSRAITRTGAHFGNYLSLGVVRRFWPAQSRRLHWSLLRQSKLGFGLASPRGSAVTVSSESRPGPWSNASFPLAVRSLVFPDHAGPVEVFVLESAPLEGYATVCVTTSDIYGATDGINEMGLWVSLVSLATAERRPDELRGGGVRNGIYPPQLTRFLLENCTDVHEVTKALAQLRPRSTSCPVRLLAVDPRAARWFRVDGEACVAEARRPGPSSVSEDDPPAARREGPHSLRTTALDGRAGKAWQASWSSAVPALAAAIREGRHVYDVIADTRSASLKIRFHGPDGDSSNWLAFHAASDLAGVPRGTLGEDIGTESPTLCQLTGPHGKWVAFLQARIDTDRDGELMFTPGRHGGLSGDRARAFLASTSGPGVPIDALLAASASGRFVLVARRSSLLLHDLEHESVRRLRTDLAFTYTHSGRRYRIHTSEGVEPARFAVEGARFVFSVAAGEGRACEVHDALRGERLCSIPLPQGALFSLSMDQEGTLVFAYLVTEDADGDGKLTPPGAMTNLSRRLFSGPERIRSLWSGWGDVPALFVASAAGGGFRPAEGFVAAMRGFWLRRDAEGVLFAVDPEGAVTRVPATGGIWDILALSASHGALVLRARDAALEGATLYWQAGREMRSLGSTPSPQVERLQNPDGPLAVIDGGPNPRMVALDLGGKATWLDMANGRSWPQEGRPQAVHDGWVLASRYDEQRRETSYRAVDLSSGMTRAIEARLPLRRHYTFETAGPLLFAGSEVHDWVWGRRLATLPSRPLALRSDGRYLQAQGEALPYRYLEHVKVGPLRWSPLERQTR